jgi:amidase
MELHEQTVAGLQALMAAGVTSAEEITRSYLDRIDAIDRSGPTLRSMLETNPDALRIAADLDRERLAAGARGPLHGVPIVLKDNIDTGDTMATTAGSLALEGHSARQDAFLVGRLRAAGAIVLGKTNLSEWANFRSTRSASGWSSRGGQVRNPYALDRSPCGSSSGSGVAVAAGLAAAAVGTETDGSIVCPAAVNGIVGLKPTLGVVSRSGIIPIAASQDTAGPMARTVEDAAILLAAMAGPDPSDPATRGAPAAADARRLLAGAHLRGVRLGVARGFFGKHDGADRVIERALGTLRDLGAEVVDGIDLGGSPALREQELTVLLYEFKAGLNAYLRDHPEAPVRTLEDVIAFDERHADRVMPYFRQELLEMAQAKGSLDDAAYLEARATCLRLARDEGIDAALRAHALDALVAPTAAPAWVIDPIVGDRSPGGCSGLAAIAGYPHVSVPAGFVHGLPVGLSFFGAAFHDGRLLSYAHAFEQAADARRAPTFPGRVV